MCMRSEVSTEEKLGCSRSMTPFSLILTVIKYLRLSFIARVGEKRSLSVMAECSLIVFRHKISLGRLSGPM
jgi:hypothetical protein